MADTLAEVQKQEVHGHDHDHHDQGFVSKYIFSTDHKIIAMQYLFTGMLMGVIGGYMAYVSACNWRFRVFQCLASGRSRRVSTIH